MKVYVHYEAGTSDTELTLKLTLPKKWMAQPISQVLELFVESYNKKRPNNELDLTQVHFSKANGETIQPYEIVQDCVSNCADLYVNHGPPHPAPDTKNKTAPCEEEVPTNQLRCRNYGCNLSFTDETNHDTACKYHTAPPVFHDTKKGWSCCPKRVYDWDEFNLIEGCTVGRHSTVDPKELFAPSPTVSAATMAQSRSEQPVLKSIEDFNRKNPNAATALNAVMSEARSTSTVKSDGTATCLNKGCQKDYRVIDNHHGACRFHASAPVFHDAGKFWSCCPDKVKYDFDAFLRIPGCMLGWHNDGTPESLELLSTARKATEV